LDFSSLQPASFLLSQAQSLTTAIQLKMSGLESALLDRDNHQSINVITRNVHCSTQLWPLRLSSEYYQPISGEWENKGHTVEFTPDDSVNAIMTTPVGRYKLSQLHTHWGAGKGQGSEHLIDGRASEFEIHFVHNNIDVADDTARDANAVLSIRGRLQYVPISGIYS
jgi:hypothetical protein